MEKYSARVAAWFPGTEEEYERIRQTNAPTTPGWYWFYDAEIQEWDCIHVRLTENYTKNEIELVADTYHKVYIEDIKCELVSEMKGQWSDPIKEPS